MTQDEKELSEIARSIASLFGDEELDTAATEQSGAQTADHPDFAVSLGLEDSLDADSDPDLTTTPDLTTEPDLSSEPALGDPDASPVESASIEDEMLDEAEVEPSETGQAPEVEETPEEAEPELSETGRALGEATDHYLQAPIHEREVARRELLTAAEASLAAEALDEVAANVNVLLVQGAGVADVEDLVGELMDEDVLREMVVLLGRVRNEDEREALMQAFTKLDDPVASVVADVLTDEEDRLARKTYVAVLGDLGSAGAQAAEKMLQDSRWFVVRNGVAVIGVVGGPSAIEPLMDHGLTHERAEVRRETVRSLAKIGGDNAGSLASNLLADSDAKVRAAAARAVSTLKVVPAYKQLVGILKEGDEDAVIEQVLSALGALGDASAVPAIVKRMKGSIFRRPSKAVRLACLVALAAIGTPHAVGLVKKARNHKDPEISSTAARLVAPK